MHLNNSFIIQFQNLFGSAGRRHEEWARSFSDLVEFNIEQ